ncbi:hypothetical protein G3578_15585 [Brevibacillus sp. SYP-B805]|uniref:hypothetical protein n=1 Tax=Brevibacillus sp. SYP-B805 TaxID=1578199 RepID=UPI0013EC0839|nr:hypothetical protein [Brevibacillus sp. SYP-B805]NGQ96584.1 hypothetical protein [Brevibacillus sp. SYP-B805]
MIVVLMLAASLVQPFSPVPFQARPSAVEPIAATTEYDLVLTDWQQGKPLALKHPLFQLDYVRAGEKVADTIVFQGTSFGQAGEITLDFYTTAGDPVFVPKEARARVRVDREHPAFTLAASIPPLLRGRSGVVQVTFSGARRAAFLLHVTF